MKSIIIFLLSLFILTAINPVEAEQEVSLSVLMETALRNNRNLQAQRKKIAQMQGRLLQSKLFGNPQLQVEYSTGSVFDNPEESSFSTAITQTLELGGKRSRRIKVAELELQKAKAEVADQERQFIAEIKTRFAEGLEAIARLEATRQILELSEKNFNIINVKFQEGEASQLELGLLFVEKNRVVAEQVIEQNSVRKAVSSLRLLAAIASSDLKLTGDLRDVRVKYGLQEAIGLAMQNRPDLLQAELEVKQADVEIQLAKAESIPDLDLWLGYSQEKSGFDQFGLDADGQLVALQETDRTLAGGISFLFPFFNRNQGTLKASIAAKEAAETRWKAQQDLVRWEVTNAYATYEVALRVVELYEKSILDQSKKNLEITQAAFELGELRLLDVLNERQRYIDVQKTYTSALKDYYVSVVEIEKVIGITGGSK
jgi:cobalt-zinc-cadmium efflux system outer membrane protein